MAIYFIFLKILSEENSFVFSSSLFFLNRTLLFARAFNESYTHCTCIQYTLHVQIVIHNCNHLHIQANKIHEHTYVTLFFESCFFCPIWREKTKRILCTKWAQNMEKLNERDLFKIFSFWQERATETVRHDGDVGMHSLYSPSFVVFFLFVLCLLLFLSHVRLLCAYFTSLQSPAYITIINLTHTIH